MIEMDERTREAFVNESRNLENQMRRFRLYQDFIVYGDEEPDEEKAACRALGKIAESAGRLREMLITGEA
mgnify:CR=1 FL=1